VEPEGFRKLVDYVGGMQVNVPFAMDYDDPMQKLHIHLAPGPQKLHGEQVLEFLRWRHNNEGGGHPEGEAGRLRMQQELLQGLLDQLVSPRNLPRLPSLAMAVAAHVHATMEPARLISLVRLAVASRADLAVATLPGIDAALPQPDQQGRRSYFLPDPDGTARLVDRLIRGIDPGTAASIRVEVAAPDDHDKAARITARLAAQGFAVSTIAPPAAMPAATQVIDLRGDAAKAQLVAGSLVSQGLAVELLSQPDSKATADVRVIFGSDVRSTFNGS
jgi:anionic cell wall polymer biosynthesis LytR-Cps2A-Psr (LCP) family protein